LIRSNIGNSGLGQESVLQLAKHNPSQIFLAARSPEKGQAAIQNIKEVVPKANITFLQLDLTSFTSIVEAAKVVNSSVNRLDILMNNAGIMMTPPGTTKDGSKFNLAPTIWDMLSLPIFCSPNSCQLPKK
jgi:retinol dehydrogenase-12